LDLISIILLVQAMSELNVNSGVSNALNSMKKTSMKSEAMEVSPGDEDHHHKVRDQQK
jgi:hypothetical protein